MEYETVIIGICGLKNSGKDTVADYLVKQYEFEKLSYAAPLKKAAAALLDIPLHEIENFKNDETVFVTTGYKNEPTHKTKIGDPIVAGESWYEGFEIPNHMWSPIRELTFREFLQRFGTEMGRECFGEDFWVKQCLPHGNYVGRKIVIADVRFPNEVERIHFLGGKIIYISRPSLPDTDYHLSEKPWNLNNDHIIVNNSSIHDLYADVELALEQLLI